MKRLSRVSSLIVMLGGMLLPGAVSAYGKHATIEVFDHRTDYYAATRLAYRLASLAEDLSRGYPLASNGYLRTSSPYAAIEDDAGLNKDHTDSIYELAEKLHQSASRLYHALRSTRRYGSFYDHRDGDVDRLFSEVRFDYFQLREVVSYRQIREISQAFSRLAYALTGRYDY